MAEEDTRIDVRKDKDATAPAPATDFWAPLTSLRQEIDRMFDDFDMGLWRRPALRPPMPAARGRWQLSPVVDMVEDDGAYRITAELPGLSSDDVEIKLNDGMITLRGEKSEEHKEEKSDYHLCERRFGAFQRSFALPRGIDEDAITARFDKGVLTVILPKSAEAKKKARRVEISAG